MPGGNRGRLPSPIRAPGRDPFMDKGYFVLLAMLAAYAATGLILYLRARGSGAGPVNRPGKKD